MTRLFKFRIIISFVKIKLIYYSSIFFIAILFFFIFLNTYKTDFFQFEFEHYKEQFFFLILAIFCLLV